ncbi:GIY-YIG nuclease family protein [Phenylobacterium sp.]|uniref:GIY-YIG nuclease family protein n=1 Tax=Phenylobacterium sp. TaxID=1871053 RepID=UPI0028118BD3|nr:GIY-YIG nuclease family protein [Phenylobacterium sp.]
MDKADRRQRVRDYKEKKTVAGIYALRCPAADAVWVGVSQNIDAQENSIKFVLRMGSHPNRDIQAALRAHGGGAFSYEVLERIEEPDLTPLGLSDLLKRRERHWVEALAAKKAA